MKNFKKLVGQKIRRKRVAEGFGSQRALAEVLKVDTSRVNEWENGKHLPEGLLRAELLKQLKAEESLLDIDAEKSKETTSQSQLIEAGTLTRLLSSYIDADPEWQLAALYFVTGDESVRLQLAAMPDCAKAAKALKSIREA